MLVHIKLTVSAVLKYIAISCEALFYTIFILVMNDTLGIAVITSKLSCRIGSGRESLTITFGVRI